MCEVQRPAAGRVPFRHPQARVARAPIDTQPAGPVLLLLPFLLVQQFLSAIGWRYWARWNAEIESLGC